MIAIYDEESESMYTAAYETFEVKISREKTFYTQFGDIFCYICMLLLLGTGLNLVRCRV
jgi:apolipoprotein N-acyltransferase